MNVLYFTYPLNGLLMIALPLALGVFLARRLGVRWALYAVGALTFVASQAVHLPLNLGLTELFRQGILPQPPAAWHAWFNPVVLGLTAGLSEEVARYLVYRAWIKTARTWREALMFGAGHGGVEAVLLGAAVLAAFGTFFFLQRSGDLSAVPAEQQAALAEQLAAYWSAEWPASLLGAVERAFSLCLHLALAVVVLQAVTRRNLLWLAGAVLWHAAANAAGLMALQRWGPYWAEAVIGAFALASVGMIFALRGSAAPPDPPVAPAATERPAPRAAAPQADPEADLRRRLDETKFDRRQE